MKVLEFKTISPFFELCRDGEKPFDIRLIDHKDKRFKALSQWGSSEKRNWRWYIRFTNPITGETFTRKLVTWEYIRNLEGFLIQPEWLIMYLGELV